MRRLALHRLDYAVAAGMLCYAASAVVVPVCLPMLARDFSLSLAAGGGIEVARTVLLLAVLVLGGFFAARWGKVRVLGAGAVVLSAGLLLCAAAPGYAALLLAAALAGLGGGLLEGLLNPLVQDLHPGDSGRYLNIVNAFWSIGVTGTVLLVGELLTRGLSWRVIFAGAGLLGLFPALLFLRHAPSERSPACSAARTWARLRTVLDARDFWSFGAAMFFAGGAEGAFTFWTASYIAQYYSHVPRAGGFGTACFAGGMMAGRLLSGHAVRQARLRELIQWSALAGLVVSLLVPAVRSLPGLYVLLGAAGLSVACFWPSIQSYAAERVPVDATLLFILLSCAGIPGFAASCWLMGWIGDRAGLRASFAVTPLLFGLLLLALRADDFRRRAPRKPGPTPAGFR